jgi:hypothetical protein
MFNPFEGDPMFSTAAEKRLKELQSKVLLSHGEEMEVKHLLDLKWKAMHSTDFRMPDIEALARAAEQLRKAQQRAEKLKELQGQ